MKNLFIIGVLIIAAACSSKETTPKQTTPAKVEKKSVGTLKIGYYDQDSLSAQFKYFKDQQTALEKKQKAFQGKVDQMTRDYQEFLKRNDERNRQGLLSQIQLQRIQEEAMMKEQSIVEFQQKNGGQLEKEAYEKMDDLNKKVESYSKMFSEANNLDILLIKAKGGQLAYINGSMDVTKEFIEYLNAREEEIKQDMGK
ncbi:MAG: OmpH family outer membrane protein [Bacteroidetes bacterium]|nr:OmpH family outer membrane protein [Bacteroidota bacterium]